MSELPDPPWGSAVRVREEGDSRVVTWPLAVPMSKRHLQAAFHLGLVALPLLLLSRVPPGVVWGMAAGLGVPALWTRDRATRMYLLGFAGFVLAWSFLPPAWQGGALWTAGLAFSAFELDRIYRRTPSRKGEARLVLHPGSLEWESVRLPREGLGDAVTTSLPTPADAAWLAEALDAWEAKPLPTLPPPSPSLNLEVEDTPDRLSVAWRVPGGNLRRALRAALQVFLFVFASLMGFFALHRFVGFWAGVAGALMFLILQLAIRLPALKRLAFGHGEARLLLRSDRLRWEAGGGLDPVSCPRADLRETVSGLERRDGKRWKALRIRPPGAEEARWVDQVLRAWMRA